MSTLAATPPLKFRKMNGLGNEIVVVDLRGQKRVIGPEEARAVAAEPSSRFDQMMVLHDPRTPGTEAYVRIYNTDGSEAQACGNGMRCVGWWAYQGLGRGRMKFETLPGVLDVVIADQDHITVDMGQPRFAWNEIPLAEPFHDTRRIELQIGPIDDPILHSPSVVNVGNPHCVFWVADVEAYDLGRFGPMLENHPIFPERANISLAAVDITDANPAAHLGARCRADAGLRIGRVCRRRARRPHPSHRAQGHGACARRTARYRMDRGQPHSDDRTGDRRICRRVRFRGRCRAAAGLAMTAPTVVTLGCRLNAYESEVMKAHAVAAGLDDAVIVNTCAVTAEVRAAGGARRSADCAARTRLRASSSPAARRRSSPTRFADMARGRSRHRQCREDAGRDIPGACRSAIPSASSSTTS